MHKLSLLAPALGLFARSVQAQQVALPEVTGAGSGGGSNCNGCYVVADVAGIAFGTEVVNAVQTNQVIVGSGRNGSTYTTTSIIYDQGQFTAGPTGVPAAPAGSGGANTAYNTDGTTVVLNGVTLTSPTAYNVFTAYSVTSSVYTNGACQVVAGTSQALPTAFSVVIPEGVNMASFQVEAEKSFIAHIGSQTCSPGGENYAATTQIPVNVSTTSITSTATARLSPQPASVAATTAATTAGPTSTFIPFSVIANASQATYLPGGTGTIYLTYQPTNTNTNTIAVGAAPRSSVVGSWFAGLVALLVGVVA